MKEIMQALVDALDAIYQDHPEVWDSAVRVEIFPAIERGYADADESYVLPKYFAMLSRKADAKVRKAVGAFIRAALAEAKSKGLSDSAARCRAIAEVEKDVISSEDLRFSSCIGRPRTTEQRRQKAEEEEREAMERAWREADKAVYCLRLMATELRLGRRAFDLLDELDAFLLGEVVAYRHGRPESA